MKSRKRKCARCGRKFRPKTYNQKYHSSTCQNRDGQGRLRARAKRTTELAVELGGAYGA